MAKVKMEMSELKELERKIEVLEGEKNDLLLKQKQVWVLHKYFNASIRVVDKAFNNNNITITGIARAYTPRADYWNASGGPIFTAEPGSYLTKDMRIGDALANGLIEIVATEDISRSSSEYVNLHEVVENIESNVKKQFESDLAIAKNRALIAESKVEDAEETAKSTLLKEQQRLQKKCDEAIEIKEKSYDKALEEVSKNYDEEIDKANTEIKTLKEKYDKLSQEYDDYKNDRKRLTLEQQIEELKAELKAEREKSWWKKIIS